MQREILKYPHQILKTKSQTIQKIDENILCLAVDITDTINAYPNCVGLAANQIGELHRIIGVSIKNRVKIMVNPVVISGYNIYADNEGCMSCDGASIPINRFRFIDVEYTDLCNKYHTEKFIEFTARIIQHEIDHLNGVCIVDK